MEAYVRYFVSQHLGKAVAMVECDDDAGGHVSISLPERAAQRIEYGFDLARVAQRVPERARLAETIARIAIHQAHKQFHAGDLASLFGPEHELALDTTPWLGDLEPVPYGGGTAGYEQRAR